MRVPLQFRVPRKARLSTVWISAEKAVRPVTETTKPPRVEAVHGTVRLRGEHPVDWFRLVELLAYFICAVIAGYIVWQVTGPWLVSWLLPPSPPTGPPLNWTA